MSQVLVEQVMQVKPDILATACPYCLTMLDNEVREGGLGPSLNVMDIAEILLLPKLSDYFFFKNDENLLTGP